MVVVKDSSREVPQPIILIIAYRRLLQTTTSPSLSSLGISVSMTTVVLTNSMYRRLVGIKTEFLTQPKPSVGPNTTHFDPIGRLTLAIILVNNRWCMYSSSTFSTVQ